ncbi:MAG: hypothetical protein COA33_004740 [Fluviicola sp.]|nr:hypothetical protein [Fluviicola sp.]
MKKSLLKHLQSTLTSLLLIITITTTAFSQKQKSFVGMLEYKITARDTSMKEMLPDYPMVIYSNDTITRTENITKQLGQQVVIHHMLLNKSYLLLKTAHGKFAIKTDLNENKPKSDTTKSNYTFKKKFFKTKILGMKAKRMLVSHPSFEEPIEFLYLKKTANKYNKVFDEIPGLLVKYSIPTADGILDYELVKISKYTPEKDMFGIPSDFKKVTFDEFIEVMTSPDNQKMLSPEEMN